MGLFYKVSDKEMLNIRNKIFLEKGLPSLNKNGFEKNPFSSCRYGRNNLNDFDYVLCRLTGYYLELVLIYIARGDSWIKIKLNILELYPPITSLKELGKSPGIKYWIPPASLTTMRLRSDDYKWIPVITPCFFKEHKIGSYNSKYGLNRQIRKLGELIEKDMTNIDSFVSRWHELHIPSKVDWDGNVIE